MEETTFLYIFEMIPDTAIVTSQVDWKLYSSF